MIDDGRVVRNGINDYVWWWLRCTVSGIDDGSDVSDVGDGVRNSGVSDMVVREILCENESGNPPLIFVKRYSEMK